MAELAHVDLQGGDTLVIEDNPMGGYKYLLTVVSHHENGPGGETKQVSVPVDLGPLEELQRQLTASLGLDPAL